MSFNKFELDGCGFNFNLFHLLWLQDPIFKNNIKIDIPDTIQIIQGQPHFWYYSSDSQILRKSKSKLNLQDILTAFVKNKDDNSEICALWITSEGNETVFEYLTQSLLCQLIDRISYETMGFIQKFIYPKSTHNQVVKCNWGNRLCFFECFTNKYPLNMIKADIYQRAVTFEMPNGPVETSTLKGTQLAQKLELFCGLIVSHISNVTQNQKEIQQMEMFFKISRKNTIYLMFCSKIQTFSDGLKHIQQPIFKLTSSITTQLINYPKAITLSDNTKCIACEEEKNELEFSPVQIKDIINYWEKNIEMRKHQNSKRNKETNILKSNLHAQQMKMDPTLCIPKALRNLFPRLTFEEYREFKNSIVFLNQTLQVCSICFTNLHKHQEDKGKIVKLPIRIHKRVCKTETCIDDIYNIQPLPTVTPKRNLYLNYMEHKIITEFTAKKIPGSLSIVQCPPIQQQSQKQQFKQTTHSRSIAGNSIFKTTQSSRTGPINQKDFE